jgi:hypothetical protein
MSPIKFSNNFPFSKWKGPSYLAIFHIISSFSHRAPIRFRTSLRNTVIDVMKSRGWKEAMTCVPERPCFPCFHRAHFSRRAEEASNTTTIASSNDTNPNEDWDFFWADVHWIFDVFDQIHLQEHQRVNHFRNHYEVRGASITYIIHARLYMNG